MFKIAVQSPVVGCGRPPTHEGACVRCVGLVPEPALQREAHEAAERAGGAETCVLPEPEAHEDVSGQARTRRAHPERPLLLLRR